ncbi:MAG TPA: hypothetical protein VJ733_14985, partial [Candidatus Binatia bacterium]|nr:hypothetical protein [Candidatus Binatia bacterium]
EGIGAIMLFLWAMRFDAPTEKIDFASVFRETHWMSWVILLSVVVWLFLVRRLHQAMRNLDVGQDNGLDCVRFPDQCPTTTELGKGIA